MVVSEDVAFSGRVFACVPLFRASLVDRQRGTHQTPRPNPAQR